MLGDLPTILKFTATQAVTPISAVIILRDKEALHLIRNSSQSKNRSRVHSGKLQTIPDKE